MLFIYEKSGYKNSILDKKESGNIGAIFTLSINKMVNNELHRLKPAHIKG